MKPSDDANVIEVRHNAAEQRFEAEVDGGLSVADYVQRDGERVFTHTYTPPGLRGRGIAEKIVRAALDDTRAENLRVVPTCSYVALFIARHPEYRALVASRTRRGAGARRGVG